MTIYKVVSRRQRELKNGSHFVTNKLYRAVTEARIIAGRRKTRMYVVVVKRLFDK